MNYRIDVSDRMYVVVQLSVISGDSKKTKVENIGKITEKPIGYFSSVESALNHIHKLLVMEGLRDKSLPLKDFIEAYKIENQRALEAIKEICT